MSNSIPPLNSGRKEIRVLRIHDAGAAPEVKLRCTLDVVSLEDGPQYDALSYVWGEGDAVEPIRVNSTDFQVRENVYAALITLRKKNAVNDYLWIDSMCIDQANVIERTQQIALMKTIYSKAKRVHIWFGQGWSRSQEACRLLHLLANGRPLSDIAREEHGVDLGTLSRFLSFAWWDRLWVIQEASLAEHAVIHIGLESMSYRVAIEGLIGLAHVFRGDEPSLDAAIDMGDYRILRQHFIERVRRFINTGSLPTLSVPKITEIVWLLYDCNFARVSDPRDRVFGVSGLLPNDFAISGDYNSTVEAVYERAAAHFMERTGSLALLMLACGDGHSEPLLPSWVPDWRYMRRARSRWVRRYEIFNASAGSCHLMSKCSPGVLAVRAVVIDEIAKLGSSYPKDPAGLPGPKLGVQVTACLRDWYRVYMQDIEDSEAGSDAIDVTFMRVLLMDCEQIEGGWQFALRKMSQMEPRSCREWMLQLSSRPAHDESSISMDSLNYEVLVSIRSNKFMRSARGYIGLVREETQVGDVLAVLAGCNLPVVLRPYVGNGPDHYRFIGMSYVHGMMDGEATISESGVSLRHIYLR